ncbi:MAG TPA: 5-deoxy-glucuronate isomerase [Acetobacteraceae bacterium]|nr:5-deoxy-glucuronate isomerase [Acetobacteraceae bacterium]
MHAGRAMHASRAMSKLLVRSREPDENGCILEVTPASAGWSRVGFKVCRLTVGQRIEGFSADRETCIVLLKGNAAIRTADRDFGSIASRASVFDDAAPGAVYVPAGIRYGVAARTLAEVAICSAPGGRGGESRLIAASKMLCEVRGQGTNTRYVRNILPQTAPADSLLVVEVITPGGHWSSYPPHKHDSGADGEETALEETYYHRLDPPQGFAVQRVYTEDGSLDETLCVQDGDVVLVPRGYHPVGAAHGYTLYYLNVMAGPERKWIARNEPRHDWIARKK